MPVRVLLRILLLPTIALAACKDERPLPMASTTATTGAPETTGPGEPTSTTTDIATTTDTPTTTDIPTTTDTTGPAVMCGCTAATEQLQCAEDLWAHVPECPLEIVCARVTVACPRPGADLYDCQDELVIAEDALNCALAAMRDRTPGRFVVEGNDDGGIFSGASTHGVRIRGDGQVVLGSCKPGDLGTGWFATVGTLATPEFFTACLAEPNLKQRHACLLGGVLEATPLPACQR